MARSWTRHQALHYLTALLIAPFLLFSAAVSDRDAILTVQSSTADIAVSDRDVGPLLVVPNGNEITLFVVVTADPCPTIQWKLNWSSVNQSDVYNIADPCHPDSSPGPAFYNFTLTINVTMTTAGKYTAQLTNAVGTVNVSAVFVTPPVSVAVAGIEFLSSPPCLLNGTAVIIRCITSGFPRPQITFNIGTMAITLGKGMFSSVLQLDYDTLSITAVQMVDQEVYSCTARENDTEVGQSLNKSLPYCTLPKIVNLQIPKTVAEGENIALMCLFTGIPPPVVYWEKDGNVLTPIGNRRVDNSQDGLSQLRIDFSTPTDAGEYTCVVTNLAGTVMQSGMVTVETLLTKQQIIGIGAGSFAAIILITFLVIALLCWKEVISDKCCSSCIKRKSEGRVERSENRVSCEDGHELLEQTKDENRNEENADDTV